MGQKNLAPLAPWRPHRYLSKLRGQGGGGRIQGPGLATPRGCHLPGPLDHGTKGKLPVSGCGGRWPPMWPAAFHYGAASRSTKRSTYARPGMQGSAMWRQFHHTPFPRVVRAGYVQTVKLSPGAWSLAVSCRPQPRACISRYIGMTQFPGLGTSTWGGGGGLYWSWSNGGQFLGQPRKIFTPEPPGAKLCRTMGVPGL